MPLFAISLSDGFESTLGTWSSQDRHLKLQSILYSNPWIRAFIKDSLLKNLKKPWILGSKALENVSRGFLILLVGAYRTVGTTHLGGACRFTPSCSEYAVEVIRTQSFCSAVYLIVKRILKCHPGGSFGFDPAPSAQGDHHARSK